LVPVGDTEENILLKRDEVVEDWWKFHNEGLQNVYSSAVISRMIK
jgi:hypothetical protein